MWEQDIVYFLYYKEIYLALSFQRGKPKDHFTLLSWFGRISDAFVVYRDAKVKFIKNEALVFSDFPELKTMLDKQFCEEKNERKY